MRVPANANLASDDGLIAGELRLPDVVANHDHPGRAGPLVGVDQRSAEERGHPRQAEAGCSHFGDLDRLALSRLRDEVALDREERAEVDDRAKLALPHPEVVEQPLVLTVPLRVELPERDNAVTLVQRQRGIEVRVEERVGAGGERDPDGHAEPPDEGEPGGLREHARAESEVERRRGGVAAEEAAEGAGDAVESESHDEREGLEAVPGGSDGGARAGAARDVELVEVAVDDVARVVGEGKAEQGAREARRTKVRAHRALSDAGSSPCHIRSANCRASRSARAPPDVSFT